METVEYQNNFHGPLYYYITTVTVLALLRFSFLIKIFNRYLLNSFFKRLFN